jgi:hypothetical protein
VQAVEAKRVGPAAPVPPKPPSIAGGEGGPNLNAVAAADVKEAFLGEIRKTKKFFHGTVVAQAQRIDVEADKVVFVFGPQHRALRAQLEQNRPWLEAAASQLAGRKMTVTAAEGAGAPGTPVTPVSPKPSELGRGEGGPKPVPSGATSADQKQSLKERALADTGVQTMLDVFAAEIKDVEEM